jgi:predicted AAA+ superfamily ATPase
VAADPTHKPSRVLLNTLSIPKYHEIPPPYGGISKVYVRDSGLLHVLLGIRSESELLSHPKNGASWEGYAIEETLKAIEPNEAYFWATHQGAELDLLLLKGGRRLGIEIKRADAPTLTPSIRVALNDLKLDRLTVVYPGNRRYELGPQVSVMPFETIAAEGIDGLLSRPRKRRFKPAALRHSGRRPDPP